MLTPPESDEVLERFVLLVKPPGPGWRDLRKRLGVQSVESIDQLLVRFLLSSGVLFGGMLGCGAFLLHQQMGGWIGIVVAMTCLVPMVKPWVHRALLH